MTQNQTDFQKHITLVDGLLRVGMSDEALERIHALRRQHADHPDLREAEARALHQQLMCAPKPAPRLLDAFLRLDLPPEHPLLVDILKDSLPAPAEQASQSGKINTLITQAESFLKAKRHTDALEVLRQARALEPDSPACAERGAEALSALLAKARRQSSLRDSAPAWIEEYLRQVCPHLPKPHPLHSALLREILLHRKTRANQKLLFASFQTWPEMFWCPEDLQPRENHVQPRLHEFLTQQINHLLDREEDIHVPCAEMPDLLSLIDRIARICDLCPEDPDLPFVHFYACQFVEGFELSRLADLLRQHSESAWGWTFWIPSEKMPEPWVPYHVPGLCMALTRAAPGSFLAKTLHRQLAIVFHMQGKEKEARLEVLLSTQTHKTRKLKHPRRNEIQLETLLTPPWGYQPGEGHWDYYLQQAQIAAGEV